MSDIRTLSYDWEFGHKDLVIKVDAYRDRNRLYIGLYYVQGSDLEDFGDLTVNLPFENVEVNEAFINDFACKEKLEFIRKHKLGSVLPEHGYSGYCQYAKVAFDLERLAELDEEGLERYKALHGITGIEKKTVD